MEDIKFVYTSNEYIERFNKTVGIIARERKYLGQIDAPPMDTSRRFIEHILENNYAQYFAIKDNEIIGWCDAIPHRLEGMKHVATMGMGIISEYREAGIGSKLLELTIQHAKKYNKIEKAELEVYRSNKRAINFYKKHHFNVEGERIKARKLDGVYDNLIIMGRFI